VYRIYKEIVFSAAHQLSDLPPTHQCARLHGHNYRVEVEIESSALDKNGFVVDYGEISAIVKRYDHRNLNDLVPEGVSTTAENLATLIYNQLQGSFLSATVVRVRVHETETSWAEYCA
jgi:6-pyruvoyltetrahydropterin/6-carboxytetrahydropterin synthase